MIVIGDLHGKLDRYLKLLVRHRNEPSVQLGDFGIGFPGDKPLPPLPGNAWFLRGNHDNPEAARSHGNYLGDYGSKTIEGIRIFYLSGAWSSDQWLRTESVNWWRDEELGVAELEAAVELYAKIKPQIVLTHDGPDEAVRALLAHGSAHKEINRTGTGNALNAMLEAHRPRKWIFGHWHTRFRKKIGGTEFRCLPELGWCRIQGFEKREVAANAIERGRSRHDVIRSSGNVFADMGLPDAAELGARARLESEEHFKPRSKEELERDMKLARRIMRDNRKALRALADAPSAYDEPL